MADSVCSTCVSPLTSTVSASAPSSNLKSIRAICIASSWIGLVAAVLKLDSSALTT